MLLPCQEAIALLGITHAPLRRRWGCVASLQGDTIPVARELPVNKRSLLAGAVGATSTLFWPSSAEAVTLQDYMLHLINAARFEAGVPPVTLGTNRAAQVHADNMVRFCFTSHWGVDGTKPYMRYSLAGGYQRNAENVAGRDTCVMQSIGEHLPWIGSPVIVLHSLMNGLMGSPGHKKNILDKWHKKVNIGIAWDRYNFKICQLFEGDYVTFSNEISAYRDTLSMRGYVDGDSGISIRRGFLIEIDYDFPPRMMTIGKLEKTIPYGGGVPVAVVIPSRTDTSDETLLLPYRNCGSPYEISGSKSPSQTIADRNLLNDNKHSGCNTSEVKVDVIKAEKWDMLGNSFSIHANISEVLSKNSFGVYTVKLIHLDTETVFAESCVFHGREPPEGYA